MANSRPILHKMGKDISLRFSKKHGRSRARTQAANLQQVSHDAPSVFLMCRSKTSKDIALEKNEKTSRKLSKGSLLRLVSMLDMSQDWKSQISGAQKTREDKLAAKQRKDQVKAALAVIARIPSHRIESTPGGEGSSTAGDDQAE